MSDQVFKGISCGKPIGCPDYGIRYGQKKDKRICQSCIFSYDCERETLMHKNDNEHAPTCPARSGAPVCNCGTPRLG